MAYSSNFKTETVIAEAAGEIVGRCPRRSLAVIVLGNW